MTLADEDTNSILIDNANRAIQGNVAMHVTLPGGQLWNQCKWCHLVAKETGDFEWCRQTMDELSVFGTSRTSNELKSGP